MGNSAGQWPTPPTSHRHRQNASGPHAHISAPRTHRSPTAASQPTATSPLHAPNRPCSPTELQGLQLGTTRLSTRRCQLWHSMRLAHRPQHPLNRIRILNRCQQPPCSSAARARQNVHAERPQHVTLPTCSNEGHPDAACQDDEANATAAHVARRTPRQLPRRARPQYSCSHRRPLPLRQLPQPAARSETACTHPVPAHRGMSPSSAWDATPKPATAQSAPAGQAPHASSQRICS